MIIKYFSKEQYRINENDLSFSLKDVNITENVAWNFPILQQIINIFSELLDPVGLAG